MKIKRSCILIACIMMFSATTYGSDENEFVYISNNVIFFPNQETAKIGDSWSSVKGAFERSKYACQDNSTKPNKYVSCILHVVRDYYGESRHEIQILIKNGSVMDIEWVQNY